jgi:hypothetical protein
LARVKEGGKEVATIVRIVEFNRIMAKKRREDGNGNEIVTVQSLPISPSRTCSAGNSHR